MNWLLAIQIANDGYRRRILQQLKLGLNMPLTVDERITIWYLPGLKIATGDLQTVKYILRYYPVMLYANRIHDCR